ncbi:MAG: hypothetical protein Q4C77_01895 [Eubacteriales bacterium]|nr:hypothetical protein [Eubacteriales bacterium]
MKINEKQPRKKEFPVEKKACEKSKEDERKCPVSATFGLISTSAFYYNVLDVQEELENSQKKLGGERPHGEIKCGNCR